MDSLRRARWLPLCRLQRTAMALIGSLALGGTLRAVDPAPLVPGTWTLQFQDDFDGTTVNGAKWRLGSHHSGIAGSAGNSPQNISVADGTLKLKAEQRAVTYSGTNYSYATGEVSTFFNHRQQNGYIEARLKYPAVTGLWPAFWLMPDRASYGWRDAYRRSYLKFDLTGVNLASVTSATLKLTVSSLETGGINNLVFMKLADDTWSESTITWNNKPVPDPIWLAQRWNNLVSSGSEITADVTAYVAQEMAGDKKISFVLADTFMRTKLLAFHSSEAGNAANRPQLVIDGVAYTATEDATVRWGTLANTNYGNANDLGVKDDWGDTATTFNGGMEVDVMESLGIWGANVTQHALHWDGYGSSHKTAGWPNITYTPTPDNFHTYGLYWEPGLLAFYVDGIKTAEYVNSRVMSVPAYFLLSLQMGGWGNNNPGPQVNNQVMEVDWVRSWSGTRAAPITVTVDNAGTADVETTGTWISSTANAGYHDIDYAHDDNAGKGTKTFTFLPPLLADGEYLVYARWPAAIDNATNTPIDIVSSKGAVSTVTVNQQQGGGQWNFLGTHNLAVLTAEATIRTTGTNGFVTADAMLFQPAPTTGFVTVDNTDTAYVASTGTWSASTSVPGYLGTNYVHDGNTAKGTKTFSFKPAVAAAGDHLVYARWPADANRASNVPVDIVKADGSVATVIVNQRVNNNTWTALGVFPLSPTNAEIKIRTTGTNGFVMADGVRVVPVIAP
ncbi:MAG: glucan 1,3-beta-glucosidase [Rariglobus sp.]|jgi:beta-glucanase (GH16 family)|nr:glucan 1,3-beta-glucosidase [Rariglobus sp.]